MIPATLPRAQPATWQQSLRSAVTDARELLALVGLADRAQELLPEADTGFAVRVPREFIARMRHGDVDDPLLAQVLPRAAELQKTPGYQTDALGEDAARAARGVLCKYEGRALLVATGACAVNCRYCFRRHFPYAEQNASVSRWRDTIDHIAGDPGISEVILSGGDPLALATAKLAELTDGLAGVSHVRRLRIHSRLPVVLPSRVDDALLDWIGKLPWPVVMVIHANHANELDDTVAAACAALRNAGVTLLNQSVLLRGVNDCSQALADLSEALFACGVLPYYLHQLDRVQGVAHFEVDDARALELHAELRARLSGFLVPRLVREIAGEAAKTPL